jgi:hypothetical protein
MWLSVLINPTARRMIASRANTRRPSLRGPAETKGCSQIGRRLLARCNQTTCYPKNRFRLYPPSAAYRSGIRVQAACLTSGFVDFVEIALAKSA